MYSRSADIFVRRLVDGRFRPPVPQTFLPAIEKIFSKREENQTLLRLINERD